MRILVILDDWKIFMCFATNIMYRLVTYSYLSLRTAPKFFILPTITAHIVSRHKASSYVTIITYTLGPGSIWTMQEKQGINHTKPE